MIAEIERLHNKIKDLENTPVFQLKKPAMEALDDAVAIMREMSLRITEMEGKINEQ